MLITSRSFAEYRAMFDLSDADLAQSILDCCAGASSFTAELPAHGGNATAADPAYHLDRQAVLAAISRGAAGASPLIDGNEDRFVWDWYGSSDRRDALRATAAGRFAADYTDRPRRGTGRRCGSSSASPGVRFASFHWWFRPSATRCRSWEGSSRSPAREIPASS